MYRHCSAKTSLLVVIASGSPRCGALLSDTSGRSLAIRRVGSEIDVLLRSCPDGESWDVHELASHTDVALLDEDTRVVDGLGQTLFVDLSLEATFQEFLRGKLQDEIQLELIIGKETVTTHPTEESSTLEDALGVLRVKSQQRSGSLSQLCQCVLDTPDLTLTAESVLADKLELGI